MERPQFSWKLQCRHFRVGDMEQRLTGLAEQEISNWELSADLAIH